MNTENLNGILAQYIQHCKSRTAADEGTIWRAVDCFGVNWDIDDSDFPVMFGDAMQSPIYDFDGNMLVRAGWTQSWNGENHLIETEKDGVKLQFSYDYMGRRISKKIYKNDVLVKHLLFVYDGYKLLEELDAQDDSAVLRRYCWQPEELGLDVPLSVYDVVTNATCFYMIDANKNVSDLIDSSGNVVAHYEYSPFGSKPKPSALMQKQLFAFQQ